MLIDGSVEYACIAKLRAGLMQLDPLPNFDSPGPCDQHPVAQGTVLMCKARLLSDRRPVPRIGAGV